MSSDNVTKFAKKVQRHKQTTDSINKVADKLGVSWERVKDEWDNTEALRAIRKEQETDESKVIELLLAGYSPSKIVAEGHASREEVVEIIEWVQEHDHSLDNDVMSRLASLSFTDEQDGEPSLQYLMDNLDPVISKAEFYDNHEHLIRLFDDVAAIADEAGIDHESLVYLAGESIKTVKQERNGACLDHFRNIQRKMEALGSLEELEERIDERRKQLGEIKEEAAEKHDMKGDLVEKNEKLASDLENKRSNLKELEKQKSSLEESISDLKKEKEALQTDIEELEEVNDRIKLVARMHQEGDVSIDKAMYFVSDLEEKIVTLMLNKRFGELENISDESLEKLQQRDKQIAFTKYFMNQSGGFF